MHEEETFNSLTTKTVSRKTIYSNSEKATSERRILLSYYS